MHVFNTSFIAIISIKQCKETYLKIKQNDYVGALVQKGWKHDL